MEYKDALGNEIGVGNVVTYQGENGLQIGRVLELTSINTSDYNKFPIKPGGYVNGTWTRPVYAKKKVPAIKVIGARKYAWGSDKFEKNSKPSNLTKFENIMVITGNLVAQVTLM